MMKEIWRLAKDQKVCATDLDGVLVNYPKCWLTWLNSQYGGKKEFKNLHEAKSKLSYKEYKIMKIKYRTCGVKANLEATLGATDFVNRLQENGFKVIILTARPYEEHREIWKDTMTWFKNHGITPDGVIWDKKKHWAVLREFPFLEFMVEDNAEIACQVASHNPNLRVYVLDNEYNKQKLLPNVHRVFSLNEILKCEILQEAKK